MSKGMTKAERLDKMKLLYCERSFSDAEMSERLVVDRSTIYRDRIALEREHPFVEEDGRYRIDRQRYISNVRLNMTEALSLYLAARRAAQQTRYAHERTASALGKIAIALHKPMTERLVNAAERILAQRSDPRRVTVFETVAQAWVESLQLRLDYRPLNGQRARTHRFEPYLLEPSPWSDSIYVIGHSDLARKVITLKLERIERAVLGGRFERPEDFDEQTMLSHAWGVWSSDEAPQTVTLRFAPGTATRRLKETIWHPLERITDTEDGGCIWETEIAEWREMLPWVRGWGSDVEVVGPEALRDELAAEVRRMAKTYQIDLAASVDPIMEHVLKCWGKTNKTDDDYHPALFHMIDVACVAETLLSPKAPARFRSVLSRALQSDGDSLVAWLPWMIALHDIGKITASFQMQNAQQKQRLQKEGFSFARWSPSDSKPHSVFSQSFIVKVLSQANPTPRRSLQRAVAEVIGGHHGVYHSNSLVRKAGDLLELNEPEEWHAYRSLAETLLRQHFLHTDLEHLPEPENVSTATMMLSGFTILCDWIGSDSRFFASRSDMELGSYLRHSRRQAQRALEVSGLFARSTSDMSCAFSSLFADIAQPRPLQLAIDQIPEDVLVAPSLVIIEAPTGEGKTEASLAIAHRIAQHTLCDDFYYALPTMATSNQMFLRLQEHLRDRLGLDAQAKLVHGQSFLIEDELRIEPLRNGSPGDKDEASVTAVQWFNGKKRSLLAPFGVGTVDQAEMAVLNARHMALRMFGLAGKVVIIDEVHAYDTYMTTIIEQLLRWLSKIGTSVILLSATLPLSRRAQLVRAFGIDLDSGTEPGDAYPSLLAVSRKGIYQASPTPWQDDRSIELKRLYLNDEQAKEKAEWLLEVIQEGGCACWMTNTVRRAQNVFDLLLSMAPAHVDLSLLHAQFPLEDRQKREEEITGKYGPRGGRPSHGIVIGTQVLEQSLDLDFDVMVSDLAPIDLLLQRAGRLHRHKRARPSKHEQPVLWINLHADEQPMIPPVADRKMYTEFILRQTWSVLAGRGEVRLPQEYRPLIEAVYDAGEPANGSDLRSAWDKLCKMESYAVEEANIRLVPDPDPITPFTVAITQKTFEEDENSAAWVVARTRLGEESLNVIPLEVLGGYGILPDGTRIHLDAEADRETQLRLLRRGLRVSRQDAIQAIRAINEKRHKLFADSALLRDQQLLPLEGNAITLIHDSTKLICTLHPRLGLVIERNKD